MNRIIQLAILLGLTFISSVTAQNEAAASGKGSISGRVVDASSKSPLVRITVRLEGTDIGTYTDQQGRFKLQEVDYGFYAVKFSGVGYQTYTQSNVVVNSANPALLEVELVAKPVEAAGVEVRASYFGTIIESVTSTQILTAEEIRRAPGVQEDVIRATALLPGVGVTQAGRNDLVVRGGAPFENLFIVDNIEVPNINHFGSQGSSGGPLSIINIDYVKDVTFSAGGFGAKFGDKTSSMTNITLRNGNSEKIEGKATLSATGFALNLESPISADGSLWFSARRSYLDLIFKAAGFGFIPQYWDLQSKLNYKINHNNRLSFLAIGALDDVTLNNSSEDNRYTNSRVAIPNQKQYFSGLTWQNLFADGYFEITLGETYTNYSIFQNDSNLVEVFKNKSKEQEMILRSDLYWKPAQSIELLFGNQVKYAHNLSYDVIIPGYLRTDENGQLHDLRVDTSFTAYKNSTYASITSTIGNLKLTLGGRLDYFNFTSKSLFVSPRMSLVFQLNPVSAFNFSAGRYYQSPSYVWIVGGNAGKLNPIKADQIVFGYDHTPFDDLKVQLEVFYKWYSDYPAREFRPQAVLAPSGFDDITNDIPFGLEPLLSSGTGFSRGVELFIQKKLSAIPLYGLFSLSISESRFKSLDGIERAGAFDTRVIANLSVGYRFDSEWEASTKFRMATGLPTTPYNVDGTLNFSQYNAGERLPLFHALDLRVDKRWNFTGFALVTYIDIQNIYGRKNVNGTKWNQREQKMEYQESIGILPSIGIIAEI